MDADELSHCFIVTSDHTLKSGPCCPRTILYSEQKQHPSPCGIPAAVSRNMLEVQPLGCMSLLPTL